ncbi:MAG: hypothetical protein WBI40_03455, partial [Methylococcaceae bacterium]
MNSWDYRLVPFKFQLSDWTFFIKVLPMQVRSEKLLDDTQPVDVPALPTDPLLENSQGFLIRGLPITKQLPTICSIGDYICYVSLQYQHCYID